MPLQSLLNASRILLRGISQVFLQGDPRLGLACLLAIAVGAPPLLAGALLGGALGPLLARLLHCADSDIEAGLYGYNAVLIGMLLAFRFAWSPGLVSLVALGCLASVALQRLFLHGLRRRRWLPPYTLGFVLNGWWLVPLGAWLGLAPAAHGGCFSCAWSGTAELAALTLGIGEIIFLGEPLAGLLVWLGLLLVSRPSAAWALCGAGRGQSYRLECELPSLSRPLYECILTGVPPIDSGILHNDVVRLSQEQSLFHYARAAGLSTAAAAYHWVSELYNRAPFDPARDRHTDDSALPIQRGHFYWNDHYPDSHLFADAESLRRRHAPNFMLVHSMNIDDAGHRHGLASPAYRNAARRADALLSEYLHQWLAAGYQVAITADHGMNEDRSHGGILEEEREVPLFVFGDAFSRDDLAQPLQTDLCGTLCEILGAAHDKPVCRELLAP